MMRSECGDHFAWQSFPARERPRRAALGLTVITAVAVGVHFAAGPMWACGAWIVLVISLNRFYLPSRFEIDPEGITARYPLRRQRRLWSELRRFVCDRDGGFLSTRSRASWLDPVGGMHVLFGADTEKASAMIRRHMDRRP